MVARLKPFADRKAAADSVQATDPADVRRGRADPAGQRAAVQSAADHRALDRGGFEYQLEALEGQDPAAIGSVASGLIGAANRDPRLTRVFSTFTATNPSIYLDIDRAKAQALGLNISDMFTALQATLGGIYVNNFNLYRPHLAGQRAGRGGRIAATFPTSGKSMFATAPARWCRSAPSPASGS